ncbi:YcaO-like family protein [Streptomyces sp. NPDC046261]|uniref:YcaO-like family protein n=1 Tax=Streptomyces sp. NPDC046261 TaxID=3157200 RepID=UPI0033D74BF5
MGGKMLHQYGEREIPLAESWKRGTEAIAALGLTAAYTDLGGDPGAWHCQLHQEDGTPVPSLAGCGKGFGEAAKVGALYEALEHHLAATVTIEPADVTLRSAHEISTGPFAPDVSSLLLSAGPDGQVACRSHRAVHGDATCDVPVFVNCPWYLEDEAQDLRSRLGDHYRYGALGRYSVNSGCATGASVTEATVHAVNEVVERDAFSLLLIRTFLAPQPAPLTVVDPDTLPQRLASLLKMTEERVGAPVVLIDMTSNIGIPSFMAWSAPQQPGMIRRGCGTSLVSAYAAERALTELIQCIAVTSRPGYDHPERSSLEGYPVLMRCSEMDLRPALGSGRTVPFTQTPTCGEPEQYLATLVEQLARRGHTPYVRPLHTFANGVSVVSVVIPGLERFALITDGRVVVPGSRGRQAQRTVPQPAGPHADAA